NVLEMCNRFGSLMLDPSAPPASDDLVRSGPPHERVQQDHLQVAAMNGELRHVIAGETASWLAVNELAEPVVKAILARGYGHVRERLFEPKRTHLTRRVRQDIDAYPDRLEFGRRLEDPACDSGAMKHQPHRQSADARADNQDFHDDQPFAIFLVGTPLPRQRLLEPPGGGCRKKQRYQNIVAGERNAQETPGGLVASDDPDVLKSLEHIIGRPETVDRPRTICGSRPELPFDSRVVGG